MAYKLNEIIIPLSEFRNAFKKIFYQVKNAIKKN